MHLKVSVGDVSELGWVVQEMKNYSKSRLLVPTNCQQADGTWGFMTWVEESHDLTDFLRVTASRCSGSPKSLVSRVCICTVPLLMVHIRAEAHFPSVISQAPPTMYLKTRFLTDLELATSARLAALQAQRPPCLCLSRLGAEVLATVPTFCVGSRDGTGVLTI